MKTSDYIVEYLIAKGITDVFGYPGGMVTHLMDSFSKYQEKITAHVNYNEQGAAMAACGYAQVSGKCGVAYATSGPGATNLITGICNAYMDSIPTLFITGQVNSFEQKCNLKVRQRGFQETDIVSMVKSVTKYAVQINDSSRIKFELDKAFHIAQENRKGPVLLDIAMDVTRLDVDVDLLEGFCEETKIESNVNWEIVLNLICKAQRPVILLGNGVSRDNSFDWKFNLNKLGVPVVTSMIAVELQESLDNTYGFIGAYGDRTANFIVAKSDLVISVGARLDVRQVGAKRENFAPSADIIRIDIDLNELEYKVHNNEYSFISDSNEFLKLLLDNWPKREYFGWINICNEIKNKLYGYDDKIYNKFVRKISEFIPENSTITTDVGQNQVWVAQSLKVKRGQRILFSGGHGAMGYSLPSSIGAFFASNGITYSFNGDGGIQMNIQELQLIAQENLPVKIILFNNNSLGMIRHFQEMYFNNNFFQTIPESGFSSPNFMKLSDAYGIEYRCISNVDEIDELKDVLVSRKPSFIEIQLKEKTYVFPKLEFGKPNHDQEPLLDRDLYTYLMKLGNYMNNNKNIAGGVNSRLGISLSLQYSYYNTEAA